MYGPDIVDRLRDAGFWVVSHGASDMYSEKNIARMGLRRASRPVFVISGGG
jgi:hypothetical protein